MSFRFVKIGKKSAEHERQNEKPAQSTPSTRDVALTGVSFRLSARAEHRGESREAGEDLLDELR